MKCRSLSKESRYAFDVLVSCPPPSPLPPPPNSPDFRRLTLQRIDLQFKVDILQLQLVCSISSPSQFCSNNLKTG